VSAATGRVDLLLDTNVLLLHVIGTCDPHLVERFGRTSSTFGVDDLAILEACLSTARSLVTTPAVLAEVSNLCRGVSSYHQARARRSLRALIEFHDERSIPSRECASHALFERLGLTDAGIALLAAQGVRVLTTDVDLYVALAAEGVDVVNFNHLRAV
jgi:predicted nucleic acid-binding protein